MFEIPLKKISSESLKNMTERYVLDSNPDLCRHDDSFTERRDEIISKVKAGYLRVLYDMKQLKVTFE